MQYSAISKNSLISEQKLRKIVRDLKLTRRPVTDVIQLLSFVPKKGAQILLKVVNSAVANAENNGNQDVGTLFIETIQVDQGMRMKRMMPRAKGRSNQILKKRSHVRVVVSSAQIGSID
ncbi:50S ribosomal protein L22 [bacterium]|jgi:large subunit ribosomal protein L22|nr:50S ribosomal protein L22 [bacterium]NBX71713.1 50S ribosomal protein L22 [bacterium]